MFTLSLTVRNVTEIFFVFRKSARNFNPVMCTAADVTIVEVEELVEAGSLDSDFIHVPGIYVDRIIVGENYEKRVEVGNFQYFLYGIFGVFFKNFYSIFRYLLRQQRLKVQKKDSSVLASTPAALLRERIVRRAALEFEDGMYGILLN